MEREAFRQRMQQYKQARENNPQLKYWDWKKYADCGEVRDNTYVASMHKEQVFIPASGAQKMLNDYQYKYGSKSPYKGGELETVSPEFDILTGVRGLKSTVNNLLDNYIGRKLPSDYAYRRTVQQELDDIITTNSFREIPENVVTTGGRTITLPNGKTVTLKKAKGNSHGGKAFSAGDVWKGTTSSGNNSSEIIVGVPGDNAKWMVGKHGNYQGPYNFSDIEKGSGLFVPFNTEGVANISTEGLKYFKPSKYFNNRYIKYADGGTIEEDPPTTSERPIINFNPKGNPYEAKYGYNPGAGFTRDPFSLYDAPVIGDALSIYDASKALKNKDWLGASLAALGVVPFVPSNLGRTINKSMNNYIPEVRRTAQDKINALLRRENKLNDSLGKTVDGVGLRRVPYEDALNARNRVYESVIDPENLKRARAIDSRYGTSYEAVYKGMSEKYQDPMEYFIHSYEPVLDTNLGSNTKAQVSSNPNNKSIRFSKGVNTGDYNIDTGLIRHEIGHKVDIDATRGAVNTNPFMQDLAKDILPYDQARYMLHGIENPVESYKYLTTPTEIKSHMNQFRQYLIDNKIMKPGDKVDDVPNFFMHLQAAPDEYKGIKLLQNLFKNDRAFKKRFDQIPLTNINDNRVIA